MPSGRRGRFALGTPLLQAGRALGVDIDSVCGGRGLCGRCQVEVAEGEFPKHGVVSRAEHLSASDQGGQRVVNAKAMPPAPPRAVQQLQQALRQGGWKVTVAVHGGKQIIVVWPGFHNHAYGIAVDIGSTTIAIHLCDLASGKVLATAGTMNPQIRFGEDLMSRVSYVMMHP